MSSLFTPAWLAPTWRFAGDAWTGANALTYIVYETAPVYAADGVTVITAGVPQPLAGYSVTGTIRSLGPCRGASSSIVATGAIVDPVNGIISLSLQPAQTGFAKQPFEDWADPTRGVLIAQPKIVDSNGNPVTVGLQRVFVF